MVMLSGRSSAALKYISPAGAGAHGSWLAAAAFDQQHCTPYGDDASVTNDAGSLTGAPLRRAPDLGEMRF